MFGFLFIDKPKGITSFYALKQVRRLAGVKRCGFLGTLDPLATGLLIFAIGEATKIIPLLEGRDKTYEVKIKLGETSDTYDADGEISIFEGASKPSLELIERTLKSDFLGKRMQKPPAYSAIKINGKRAYDLARKNEKFEIKERETEFFELTILGYEWPYLSLRVRCSSGTYIRSLAHDLGEKLGCGGFVEELRRTKIGIDGVEKAVSLEVLNEENIGGYLVGPDAVAHGISRVDVDEEQLAVLNSGGFLDGDFGLADGEAALAYYNKVCVGVVETVGDLREKARLKFKRKINIVT